MGWLNFVNSPYGNSAVNLFIKDTLSAEEIQIEKKKWERTTSPSVLQLSFYIKTAHTNMSMNVS